MVYRRNSQYSGIAIGSYSQVITRLLHYWSLGLVVSGLFVLSSSAQEGSTKEWVQNRYVDFLGSDLDQLHSLELASREILEGCRLSLGWPNAFPRSMTVFLSEGAVSQIKKGVAGAVSIEINSQLSGDQQGEWLARGLLTHYGSWKGIAVPPPSWLVQSIQIRGAIWNRPQVRVLLLRDLGNELIPSLSQGIQSLDRNNHPGWGYLIHQFLESGGLESEVFKQRLEQFWTHGYAWTQASEFFNPRYPNLNGAELELLWKTFVSEILSSESGVCLSESASLAALERIAQLEVFENGAPVLLSQDIWYLHRKDVLAAQAFSRKQSELEVLVVSIHPYYFNACHSLDRVLLAIERDDLDGYRVAAQQFAQDMLDAQQLSFETDRMLEKLCP